MKIASLTLHFSLVLLASCSIAATAWADQLPTKEDVADIAAPQFSPYAGRNFPTRVFFGDTHLHTAVSVDAGTMCRIGQEDAYRFARGEEITTTHGLRWSTSHRASSSAAKRACSRRSTSCSAAVRLAAASSSC